MHILDGDDALQYINDLLDSIIKYDEGGRSYYNSCFKNNKDCTPIDFLVRKQLEYLIEAEKYLLEYQSNGPIKPKIAVYKSGFPSVPSLMADLEYIYKQNKITSEKKKTVNNNLLMKACKIINSFFDLVYDGAKTSRHVDSYGISWGSCTKTLNEIKMFIANNQIETNDILEEAYKYMHNNKIAWKVLHGFYESSFEENTDDESFLIMVNREYNLAVHETPFENGNIISYSTILHEIGIQEYKFEHPLLGDDKIDFSLKDYSTEYSFGRPLNEKALFLNLIEKYSLPGALIYFLAYKPLVLAKDIYKKINTSISFKRRMLDKRRNIKRLLKNAEN